jgi:asparagine synthase (glutamine-hydrolysing)
VSGLAVAVAPDGGIFHRDHARAAAGAARYRAHGGLRELSVATATAVYLDGTQEPGVAASTPLISSNGSLLVIADARIDNRREVAARLGRADVALARDDGRLILEAYLRWGEFFPQHLAGDFAVVVWDDASRRLVAARDAMAMRPLVYSVDSKRILIASDVKQILAVDTVSRRLCEQHILATLAGSPGLPEQTFYESVRRLPPGHTLTISRSGISVRPHAEAPTRDLQAARPIGEYAERLRNRLTDAVRARLEVARSPGLLLSGGLDSVAIAGVAGALEQGGGFSPSQPLQTYSFAYDDLPECDERTVSSVVAAHYGMPNVAIPTSGVWPLGEYPDHGPDSDGPDRFRSHGVFGRTLAAARRDGIGVMMSGHRGDSVVGDVVDYLGRLREGGARALWRDLAEHARRSHQPRGRLLLRHVVRRIPGAVWPAGVLAGPRRWIRKSFRPPYIPPWLSRDAVARFDVRDIAAEIGPTASLRGEARRRRHHLIFDAQHARNAEALERLFARSGVRHVDPWSDHGVIELAMATPQHVITPAGELKGLLREAMRGVVPEMARRAAAKRTPARFYLRGLLDRSRDVVWSLIDGSQAAARGYVDAGALRTAYSGFLQRQERVSEREWRAFWRFLDLEDWLRRFHA